MRLVRDFIANAVVGGLLVVLPVWLALLLLFKAVAAIAVLVHPVAALLPDWAAAPEAVALLILLAACALVGLAVRTTPGRVVRERLEKSFFGRLPGYALFRSLVQQFAGRAEDNVWKPALAEIEDALVPAFIVEELPDGRYTVFVPSAPTPLAGAVYVLDPSRVHAVDVPFTQAIRCVSRWGSGTQALVAAMAAERGATTAAEPAPVVPPNVVPTR
ncbi:hypothetical protein [Ramlibacter sp.]|uniref:hypothetical protein n=1 Tax=Ramlibacter sp. TaxID=1917967 RepID=UPI002D5BB2AD|nr:hypothetical protein [Ramlibacter sp.]HYD75991.1 hypothetical protein [Ramlibacter sp.]